MALAADVANAQMSENSNLFRCTKEKEENFQIERSTQ